MQLVEDLGDDGVLPICSMGLGRVPFSRQRLLFRFSDFYQMFIDDCFPSLVDVWIISRIRIQRATVNITQVGFW